MCESVKKACAQNLNGSSATYFLDNLFNGYDQRIRPHNKSRNRAGARAVDLAIGGPGQLGGQAFIRGVGQSLRLSTKAAAFKRGSLLIGGAKYVH